MKEVITMSVSEKAKEKLDEASKEIKEAIENIKLEVTELTNKVRGKLKGTGEEMRESAEELAQEVKGLSEKIKELIPRGKKKSQLPLRVEKYSEARPDRWEQPFLELRGAMDRLFDDFFRGFGWPMAERRGPWRLTADILGTDWPRVDMNETDEEIRITAELPGVDRNNIEVSMTDDSVTIRGEKKEQEEKKGRGYRKVERSYGSFQRSFYLPCEVVSDKADASFKDGILTVVLPKAETAKPKQIEVKSG
jgi:HSP20 family protein